MILVSRDHRTSLVFRTAWLIGSLVGFGLSFALAGRQSAPEQKGSARRPSAPAPLKIRGVENAFRLGPRLYSGGRPNGPESFADLKRLGIKTIVSVDGSKPDVETARKFGLRYVHLPVGYDGIDREQAIRIVKAARTLPGPLFVHCHHGNHRGPAAAALCGIDGEGWSRDDAILWLKKAGTSPDYRGLFESVDRFRPPSAAELAEAGDDFPEAEDPPELVESMVSIDERWDRLKALRKTGFRSPPNAPAVDSAHEALQLTELFKELARVQRGRKPDGDFVAKAEAAARAAGELEAALRRCKNAPDRTARDLADNAFLSVTKSCDSCHARYRNVAEPRR